MNWSWWDVQALPEDVYEVLIDMLKAEAQKP